MPPEFNVGITDWERSMRLRLVIKILDLDALHQFIYFDCIV